MPKDKKITKSKRRISGPKVVNHLTKDVKHVHNDVEHLMKAHGKNGEIKAHLMEVDEHLHHIMKHGEDLRTAMPLAFLSEGVEGEIVGFRGGKGLVRRLVDMGFTPGTKVKIMSSHHPGPILVEVKGSKIALGRGVTMKIIVKS